MVVEDEPPVRLLLRLMRLGGGEGLHFREASVPGGATTASLVPGTCAGGEEQS
jgi:hypothetical protein